MDRMARCFVLAISVILLTACGGGSGGTPGNNGGPASGTLTVTALSGTGGTVSPSSAAVSRGGTAQLTVTADSGYRIDTVSGCGGTLSGSTFTTGPITANCTVDAAFTAIYTATASAGTGGTISPSSATVSSGETTEFTVTAASGYGIDAVSGCGGTLSGSTFTTGAITANCTVNATFTAIYTATASAGTGGTISPSSATVSSGKTTEFTVSAATGYRIDKIGGCGGTLSGNTYTTAAMTANCTVSVDFTAMGFAWEEGSEVNGAKGVYGTEGQPAAGNIPGARGGAVTWTDPSGNLWMFGGFGFDSAGNLGYLNDLWQYEPSTQEWTWEGGSSVYGAKGVYGTEGQAAADNIPGAREGAVTWTDASGNLWLFGGLGYDSAGSQGDLNDLWQYNPSTLEWTWEGGSSVYGAKGIEGTEGQAAAGNIPGAREGAVTWTDPSGNLWMFGGFGSDSAGNLGYLNDLWQYDPSTQEWTWEGGSGVDGSGVYGTKGLAGTGNIPGARGGAVAWTDASGNLWLFGGFGYDSAANEGDLNDLWQYDPSTQQWTWEGGFDVYAAPGVYGTEGQAAPGSMPGARDGAIVWEDSSGIVWLFGGNGFDSTGNSGYLNDLWQYDPSIQEWTWEGGSNISGSKGVYGTEGQAATGNVPSARYAAAAWTNVSGNVWLFGGSGYDSAGTPGYLNDLWSIGP